MTRLSAPSTEPGHESSPVRPLAEDQALTWFVRLNGPEVTDHQRMAFNRWLGLDPKNRQTYQAVLALWQRLDPRTSRIPVGR